MTSTFTPTFAVPARQPVYGAPNPTTAPAAPAGTFAPGTKVQVGGHRVIIVRYLSEGGFAHVYLVRLPKPINGDDGAVLKRVAVPDKEALANMRTEVETMKKLRGQRHIVNYFDSHASQLKGGGYEVFLLMEYCNGGGLIDYMNTRLQNRLTEPEVLKIFSDTALGVACMHYLKPPLLHRDLKVENILISSSGTSKRYKLCDFGSTAPPRPAATSTAEGRLIEEDVQKHTTLQYRSPEMIDVYRKQPIDEKSDIWALGVLLFKLCYYKTPFEDQGQMAILNASFKFPAYPAFSDSLKKLIGGMLREMPQARPNIYQVIREVSLMRGTDIPIKDIYAGRTPSEARRQQRLPPSEPEIASPPAVGALKAPPAEERLAIPDIVPMRRGRPTKVDSDPRAPKSSPSPLRIAEGDPFSALDSTPDPNTIQNVKETASKFPSLDEFSILHESGDNFAFDKKLTAAPAPAPSKHISQRVTDALADEAFARPVQPASSAVEQQAEAEGNYAGRSRETQSRMEKGKTMTSSLSEPRAPPKETPTSTSSKMVSTGTMTSPDPRPTPNLPPSESRPILRFPPHDHRSSSQPRASEASLEAAAMLRPDPIGNKRPGLMEHRSKSQVGRLGELRPSLSSQPSLEVQDTTTSDLNRSRSANSKMRPSSLQLEPKRKSLRSRAHSKELLEGEASQSLIGAAPLSTAVTGSSDNGQEATKISSNVEFLKAMEEEDPSKRREKRLSSGSKHAKRASMPSISLSGTKNLLSGRFGEAFRRFETNANSNNPVPPALSPEIEGYNLTPIAGSEATDGRSDDGQEFDESEPLPPEMRRELERRRLSQEERRVADAGAAYRQRIAGGTDGQINPRAASIQSKVKTLLDESGRSSPSPTKKPEGYGRFADPSSPKFSQRTPSPSPLSNRQTPRKDPPAFRVPPRADSLPSNHSPASRQSFSPSGPSRPSPIPSTASSARPSVSSVNPSVPPTPRPSAPPKPQSLRTINQLNPTAPQPSKPSPLSARPLPQHPPARLQASQSQPDHPAPQQQQPSRSQPQSQQPQQRVAQKRSSNPYRPASETLPPQPPPSSLDGTVAATDEEDWESSFSKRYPSLAGLEMVETEINGGPVPSLVSPPPPPPQVGMRVRDV
ncbi:MAG: hypothetical protein LQ346_002409 [Caloplaca aetnensis]|nr:MAG: hypothetical protein LQ346_002409 [Caloplaca aetnensis]